jgi:CRISPR-associated protein Cas2
MVVISLTDCPLALRGDLTKWLLEINAGVFVGRVNRRVREHLWERIVKFAGNGRATMVYSANNEQRLDFRTHGNVWAPIDFDGIKLMMRPNPAHVKKTSALKPGFSNASKRRAARRMHGRTGDRT